MKYYTPPDTKVMMRVGRSFFPNHNDVKLTGKSRQGVGEGGYVLWQLDYMSTVGILSVLLMVTISAQVRYELGSI